MIPLGFIWVLLGFCVCLFFGFIWVRFGVFILVSIVGICLACIWFHLGFDAASFVFLSFMFGFIWLRC